MRPRIAFMFRGVLRTNDLIDDARQRDRSRLAHAPRREARQRRFLGIHFDQFAAVTIGPERPINDVSERRGGPDYDDNVARSAIEKIFNSLQFAPRQLFAEPDNTRAHDRITLQTSGHFFVLR